MTKKVLLLFSSISVDAGMAHPGDLTALLNETDAGIKAAPALLENLVFFIDGTTSGVIDGESGRSLRDYDSVYFRYWGQAPSNAMAAARFCNMNNIPFVDNEVLRKGSQNKVTQYMLLHEAKVPIPKTLIGPSAYMLANYTRHGFTFPLILKSVIGTRGQDNYLVRSAEAMQKIFADNPDVAFVMQSFIPNEGDYRVLVMGGQVTMVIERKATGDTHLNNTSQGGMAKIVPSAMLPKRVLDLCVHAAQAFNRDIAGVDMIKALDDDSYYCLEVNRSPQIDHASFEREKAVLLAQYLATL